MKPRVVILSVAATAAASLVGSVGVKAANQPATSHALSDLGIRCITPDYNAPPEELICRPSTPEGLAELEELCGPPPLRPKCWRGGPIPEEAGETVPGTTDAYGYSTLHPRR